MIGNEIEEWTFGQKFGTKIFVRVVKINYVCVKFHKNKIAASRSYF